MTSSVISSCAFDIAFSRGSPKNGFKVPKAREWRTTETRHSGASSPQESEIAAMTSVRLGGFPVEMDAEDVPARLRQRDRARLAETGRGAENEGPLRTRFRGQNGADVSTGKPLDP